MELIRRSPESQQRYWEDYAVARTAEISALRGALARIKAIVEPRDGRCRDCDTAEQVLDELKTVPNG